MISIACWQCLRFRRELLQSMPIRFKLKPILNPMEGAHAGRSAHRQPQHQAKKNEAITITMAEKKSEVSHAEGASLAAAQKEEEEEEATCPLFMDGLPSNFADNKSLAAIASLLNDDDDEDFSNTNKQKEDKEDSIMSKVELKSGGGKVQRKTRRKGSSPYNKDKKKKQDKKAASVGEAQLFLNLWKI
mmetsp:Transcript_30667/g.61599  ORF Transcript_30667/g.61599 Transcript_30667/m.61599 type:complete len:188 (+) Transcript_30667:524-1087(+)